MRIVVTGATGNVGSAVLDALVDEPAVTSIVGLARRRPDGPVAKVEWVAADVATDDLAPIFAGADAVIHLAWLIQPSRDRDATLRVNVGGSRRVFNAAAEAGVGTLVHASSVGAYAPHPGPDRVDESWPTTGIPTSFYSRDKADAEALLDVVESANPGMRIVRLRPGIIVQRRAATEIRRLFAGPLLPGSLLRPALIPVVPDPRGVRVQLVHSKDVAEAYRLAVLDPEARGAYNIAAEPVMDAKALAKLLGAVAVPVPNRVVRAAVTASWKARLQPTPPGWLDLGTQAPLLDSGRAQRELGWAPTMSGREVAEEILGGLRDGADAGLPPLRAAASGALRVREFVTGVGGRNP